MHKQLLRRCENFQVQCYKLAINLLKTRVDQWFFWAVKSGSAGFWGIRGSNLRGFGTLLLRLPLGKWRNAFDANLAVYTVATKLGEDPSSFSKAFILSSASSRDNLSAYFFLYLRQDAWMKHAAHFLHRGE